MILPLAAVPLIMKIIAILWVFISLALILIILIQKGKGGGIGAAFGGAAGSLLGTKTGDFLTWVTISLVVLFLVLGVIMAKFYRPVISESLQQAPVAPTTMPAESTPPPATGSDQE
jgi:preprotein translocase subunit SecG